MLRFVVWVLKALLVLNVLVGVPLLGLLAFSFLDEPRFAQAALRGSPGADAEQLLTGTRLAFAAVAPVMVAAHLLLTRLLAMVRTVQAGDPFVVENADRLLVVAWSLLAIQLCDLLFGYGAVMADLAAGERMSGWSPGLTGWIAVLLTFVLARVFRDGTRMRDDLQLTV